MLIVIDYTPIFIIVKAGNHKPGSIQKGEYYHKDADGVSYQKGTNGIILRITSNPPDNRIPNCHTDNLSEDVKPCQPKRNDTVIRRRW
ncbi:hypothetical protein ACFLWU_03690 [Chloroflexota bacterium]